MISAYLNSGGTVNLPRIRLSEIAFAAADD